MLELLSTIRKEVREISHRTEQTLGLLAGETVPGPALYQRFLQNVADIRQMWDGHRRRLSEAVRLIVTCDPHFAPFLETLEQDEARLSEELETLTAAAWPRNSQIGVHSIRLRGPETLNALLHQLETEGMTVMPLLRRWTSRRTHTPAAQELSAISV